MFQIKPYIFTAIILIINTSFIQADERYRPIQDKTVKKECGDCHMAFHPQMLPQRSWKKIMTSLSDHFGEDASLNKTTLQHIKIYLMDNAADSGWWSGKFLRGIKDNMTPTKITETPYWIRKHDEDDLNWTFNSPKVKSKANCTACHPRADRGNYDDD